MSEEDNLQEIVGQMKIIEAYLNDLASKEATITRLIEEGRAAVDAIRNVSGSGNVEALMPIGIGIYMQGSVAPSSKLLVSIGSGVAVEKSREDAINYVEARMKELETALRTMFAQKQELSMKMEEVRAEANKIMRSMQKKSG
jgi:prefoldin alpha subunit